MCLAPRYISGPMAWPFSPCRNTASLPDTPCASRPTDPRTVSSVTAASPMARLLTLISCMAGIAGLVEAGPGRKNRFRTLLFGGLHRGLALLDEVLGHLHPVAVIDGAAGRQQQVARLGERRSG